jgi:hypothetical protein
MRVLARQTDRVDERRSREPYRFEELGWLQFEQLCKELVQLSSGASSEEWHSLASGSALVLAEGGFVPGNGRTLPGPTVVLIAWLRRPREWEAPRLLERAVQQAFDEWPRIRARSLLVLTNASLDGIPMPEVEVATLGPDELSTLVSRSWPLRLKLPFVLGIGASDDLVAPEASDRSTADLEATLDLARVFVPTQAYAAAVAVLGRHHFTVLTGPPEMGKTAIARMIGLVALTGGWEMHECVRPDELWARFRRDRKQVFIADDAFGSTEYRPDAAERWALELDRVLRAMDEEHWLIWTSRPAPFKAGLRRIHREHGVERFPRPTEVQVDAAELDVAEKALILFRHAKAAALPERAVELVQTEGWPIVSHPHFTPERIRRFVDGRLLELAEQVDRPRDIDALVAAEIREPTEAMASSFRALSDEHRVLLLALLDTPPGPVPERELVAAYRRHADIGLTRQPSDIVDRLTDHFLRVVDRTSVTWVHPSWRDLVIEELIKDRADRQKFLRASSIEGVVLAISVAGGSLGERVLPLMQEDEDWDALSDRLAVLTRELDVPDMTRLFLSLAEAQAAAPSDERRELEALAVYALQLAARRWDRERAAIAIGLLESWFELAEILPEPPAAPQLAPTWIELMPTDRIDVSSHSDLAGLDDWTALAEVLGRHAPEALTAFGFPDQHRQVIGAFVDDVRRLSPAQEPLARRELLVRTLRRLDALAPKCAEPAAVVAIGLASVREESELPDTYTPRPISVELQQILDAPPVPQRSDEALVARVLRDL